MSMGINGSAGINVPAGINTVIATDAIQVKILGADSAVVRFRVIALIADIGGSSRKFVDFESL